MTVNVSGVAQNGNQFMVVGSPVNVFSARSLQVQLVDEPTIGAMRDRRGAWRRVPSPLPDRVVISPRIASAGIHGWHVLFFTERGKSHQAANAAGSATIWYGRYDGRSWTDVQQVTTVRRATLDRRNATLVAAHDSLAFAFIIGVSDNDSVPRGVVMLVRRGGRWRQDTLRTWDVPAGVQIDTGSVGSRLFVVIAQDYFKDHRVGPQSIFLARYDSAWHEPTLVSGDTSSSDGEPTIQVFGEDRLLVTWQRLRPPDLRYAELQWMVVDGSGRAGSARTLADVAALFSEPGIASLNHSRVLLAVRQGDSRQLVRLFLIGHSSAQDLGNVRVPSWAANVVALAESESSAVLVTGELGTAGSSPPAWTDVTLIRLNCKMKW